MRTISGVWGSDAAGRSGGLTNAPASWSDQARQLAFFHLPETAQLASSDRTVVVCEARLDNGADLVEQSRIPRRSARPLSDAEILLALWEKHGFEAFARIEGAFAAAIFDRDAGRLILAVDALGLRPLHYARFGNALGFASTPLALARWREAVAPDLTKLASHLLCLGDVGSASLLQGVERVRPGHLVIAGSPHECRERRWWIPDLSPLDLSFEEAVEAVRGELAHAVRTQVRSGGAIVAAQLSGGLDSSAVAVAAAQAVGPEQRLVAITGEPVGPLEYPELHYWFADEVEYAAETAKMLPHVQHLRVRVEPASPFEGMDRWMAATHYPLLNACNAAWVDATYAAAAHAGAAQILTGILGNETISHDGYHLLRECVLHRRWGALAGALSDRKARGARWRGLAYLTASALAPRLVERLFSPLHGQSSARAHRALLLNAGNAHVRSAERARRRHDRDVIRLYSRHEQVAAERLAGIQARPLSVEPIAVRESHGMELLDPTASRRIVELCLRLPEHYFFRNGERRSLARALLRGRIPDRVVNERRKGTQGANWRAGFEKARPEMRAEVEAIDQGSGIAELLDVPRMRAALRDWPSNNWNDPDQVQLYRSNLMRGLGAARFVRWLREGAVGAE